MSWFTNAYRNLPSSKDMEFAVGYMLQMKMVHNREDQDKDIDLRGGTATASVKYQARAAETGNMSFEMALIDTKTGERVKGNLLKSKAALTAIVVPVAETPGVWELFVFGTKELHDFVVKKHHDKKTLGKERRQANEGRKFDDAESWLVKVNLMRTIARHQAFFRYEELSRTPAFLQYRLDNRA